VESPWFQATFGEHEHGTTWTNAEWELADGASRVAAGARGTITGKGGDHLVGDDLLKPQDANSEVIREETNHWLGETFRSRFNDPINGTWVIVAQRLHEQDPCGYLLEQMKDPQADQWYHVCLPNECDRRRVYSYGDFFYERQKGELLHAERFGEKETAAAKRGMAINYEGQYNQRPVKLEGSMLQPRWINKVDKDVPRLIKELGLRPNLYIDLATKEKETEKDDPDYTVMAVWARDSIGRFWKLDQWRDRAPLNEVVRVLIEWHKRYGIWRSVCEKGGLINTLQPFLTEACRTMRRPAIKIDKIPYGEVAQRAHALRALAAAGMIYMPAAAPWLLDTETEWRQYPKGAHDDIVTVDSYAAMDLQMLRSADPPPPARQVPDGALTGKDVDDALKAAGYAVPKR
jgi:predicted phage terminase large subunit-like protein